MKINKIIQVIMMITTGATLFAQNASVNPYGLVYQGAITKNEEGRVHIHPVSYKNKHGIDISANLYTPAGYDGNKRYPAIVVAHPNGGVKEQVAGLYAQRLAEQGFLTITADAAYQGASGGTPRNTDIPANRIEDIYGMADFITSYPGVDVGRIGILGICGGGGYTIKAVQTDKRFRAVATISMFNSGLVRRNGFQDSQLATINQRLQQASDARAKRIATGQIEYTGSKATKLTSEELAKISTDLYRQGMEYYGDTHAHPNSTFQYTTESLLYLINFDANTQVELITQPLLMISGEKSDTHYMTEAVFRNATGTQQKELFIVKGATHIETYWKPEYVEQIVGKLSDFYGKHFK